MDGWMFQFVFLLVGAMMALMLIGLGVAAIMPGMDRWNRRYFICLFAALFLYMACCLAELLLEDQPSALWVVKTLWFLESLLVMLPVPMFTFYLLHYCGEKLRRSALLRAVLILSSAFLALMIVAQFTTFLYYASPDRHFVRGPLYLVLTAPVLVALLLNLAGILRRRSTLPKNYFSAFVIHIVPFALALVVYSFDLGILPVALGITFSALSMFAIILLDQVEQYLRQQREIAQQRANILVLQMRPHFICNTMTSIYYLCDQDPQKAKQVTLDFTTYLRKNFTAISSGEAIPFSEELEHTRAYLAVEQVRYEGSLFVSYDTPHTDFRLPPLTLQPIVENAVKHGMDPDGEPLHISIRTRKTASGSELTVEDNGPGFQPADDREPHVALANLPQRLKIMCGGTMRILTREEGGTAVTVFIPQDDPSPRRRTGETD